MHKALLIYPSLPYSFWSFRETCKLTGRKTLAPPLGLITVAALFPESWDLKLVDLNARELTEEDWGFADIIVFSAMIVQRQSLSDLMAEAKRRGKTVVVGGPLVTSTPEVAHEAGCDFLLTGEAEEVMGDLVSALEKGQRSGVFADSNRPPMASSPIPRFDLLNLEDYDAISVQTSRGCPFNCEFCDIVNLFGRKPRYKSADQIIAELDAIFELGWRGTVFFCDDNFIGNPGHARELLHKLIPWMKERGEPFSFFTQASVNLGQNMELLDLMTEANFGDVFVGVESPDEDVLNAANKVQNVKNPLFESLENINRNGLPVLASFILGLDGEEPGAGRRICAFVEKASIPIVMVNMLQILPNTALWDRLSECGRLLPKTHCSGVSGVAMNFTPSRPAGEILDEYLAAWDYLYEPSRYLARAYRYCLQMRPTRSAMGVASTHAAPTLREKGNDGVARQARDLLTLARVIWRQGVKAPYRRQFWRQLHGVYKKNPSRMIRYLKTCGFGENLFALRKDILRHNRQGRIVS